MARPIPEYTVADLEKLNTIEFASMTNDDAVALGVVAVEVIRDWNLSLAVDIVLGDDLVFRAKLKSTGSGNDPWLKGKAAVATHFGEPSLLVKARHVAAGTSFEDEDLDHDIMKAHGGSIPLRVAGTIVGTLTMSGEPDATDHEAAAEAIARYLGNAEPGHEA
ncbi:MAG: heme-binding protein [Rhodoglobus sp.]